LKASQQTLVTSATAEDRYNEALAQYVRAKGEQIERLEDKLEESIETGQSSLAAGANAAPRLLAGAAAHGEWEAMRQRQIQRLEHLTKRLEAVREIREGTGLYATKVEELAEEKLRREKPKLTKEHDAVLGARRQTKATDRILNNEIQQ
jgi:anaerobic ribonucleoside-triphosphate reductase